MKYGSSQGEAKNARQYAMALCQVWRGSFLKSVAERHSLHELGYGPFSFR